VPGLQRLADELAPRGLELVTVALDGSRESQQRFAARTGLRAPVVLGTAQMARHFQVVAYPWTVIIGRDGRALQAVRGGRDEDELRAAFEKVL
jgi:AhpC/TSA family protein